jgi:hypothetical protein
MEHLHDAEGGEMGARFMVFSCGPAAAGEDRERLTRKRETRGRKPTISCWGVQAVNTN